MNWFKPERNNQPPRRERQRQTYTQGDHQAGRATNRVKDIAASTCTGQEFTVAITNWPVGKSGTVECPVARLYRISKNISVRRLSDIEFVTRCDGCSVNQGKPYNDNPNVGC